MWGSKMLGGYRALDLTDSKGFFCGKVLGELWVDIFKVERPGGDPYATFLILKLTLYLD